MYRTGLVAFILALTVSSTHVSTFGIDSALALLYVDASG